MSDINRGFVTMANTIAGRVPAVLDSRGLQPAFSDWLLTAHNGRIVLFGVLDVPKLGRLERYTDPSTVHHLSTALRGLPVFVSNSNGLRYAVLLSAPPRLPRKVDFPGHERDHVHIGVTASSQVHTAWEHLGHLLIAGMTGYGKSTFLRLLVHEAISDRHSLYLADLDGRTFPMLAGHPTLAAPLARTAEDYHDLVRRALGEMDRRATLYDAVAGYPDNLEEYNALAVAAGLDPLPRALVVLDELNSAVSALGGPHGAFANDLAQCGWRGRKFGVSLVFAAQDFSKEVVGRVRDQTSAVCFRVRSAETARAVGCGGAQAITVPGRAITDRWGMLQTYYLDKRLLSAAPASILTDAEIRLVQWAIERNDGKLTREDIQGCGWPTGEARRLAENWQSRGWLAKDPRNGNARRVTDALLTIAGLQPEKEEEGA